jgi:hypothetical protein
MTLRSVVKTAERKNPPNSERPTDRPAQICRSALLEDGFASERVGHPVERERAYGARTVPGAIVSLPPGPKQKNTSSVMPTVIDGVVLAVTDSVWWNSI